MTGAGLQAPRSGGRSRLGEVYLVGAGPGDPELLTLRALRLMRQADVVLHDRLVPRAVIDLVNPAAKRVDVGKRCGRHVMAQQDICALMVRLARKGHRVLRLKGGDPFVFGRGGEELDILARHRIPFQVVPGITAATGCAAMAGIPLTHRDCAQTVTFVTGHGRQDRLDLDWAALTRPNQTVVVYMGLRNAAAIAAALIAHGAPPTRPAAIIADGTRDDQRAVGATLATLADAARIVPRDAPALIVIGEVVRHAPSLIWHPERSATTFDRTSAATRAG